jgi:L-serine dehydratase
MVRKLPGIFNDVIGPVMRGPSSSHTAASWRIAGMAVDILNDKLEKALIEFALDGAWAPNYREQGTTMGVDGGLLGLEITDEKMKDTEGYARQKGIKIDYKVSSFVTNHANTVRLTLWGISKKKVQIVAVSLGGGSFEIQSIDGFDVKMNGDLYELLFFTKGKAGVSEELKSFLHKSVGFSNQQKGDTIFYSCKSSQPFPSEWIGELANIPMIESVAIVKPIMPVIAGREIEMPFSSIESLVVYAVKTCGDIGELGLI